MEAVKSPPITTTHPYKLYTVYVTHEHWKGMNPFGMDKIIRKMEAYYGAGAYKNTARMNRINEIKIKIAERIASLSELQLRIMKETAYATEV